MRDFLCGSPPLWAMVFRACATPIAHGVGSYKKQPSPTGWAPTKKQRGGNSSLRSTLALAQRYLHVGPCHRLVDEEGGGVVGDVRHVQHRIQVELGDVVANTVVAGA